MDDSQFIIGENRARPPYQVRSARCSSCQAPLSLYSEQSQLVVCAYCGENLDCSQEELVALGKSEKNISDFSLQLHQELIWEGVKYKIIARMLFEDQISSLKTVEYLLFHPLSGTKWLSLCFDEELDISISEDKHCLATENPFQASGHQEITTGDGKRWVKEGASEMLLLYVDGALPWLAKIGDRTKSISYLQAGNDKSYLTAEQTTVGTEEVEYFFSKYMSGLEYRRLIGDLKIDDQRQKELEQLVTATHSFVKKAVLISAILGAIIFGYLGFPSSGEELASFSFPAEEVKTERGIISPSFTLSKEDLRHPLSIEFRGPSYIFPNLVALKVPEIEREYIDLLAWEKQEEGKESFQETTLEESLTFYIYTDSNGRAEELFALEDEGHYRLHLRYSDYEKEQITETVTVNLRKNVPLNQYYLLLFGCSLWALLVWRKL